MHGLRIHVARVLEIAELSFTRECVGLEPLEQGQIHTGARKCILRRVSVTVDHTGHEKALTQDLHLVWHFTRVRPVSPAAEQIADFVSGKGGEVGNTGDQTGGRVVDKEAVLQNLKLSEGLPEEGRAGTRVRQS